MTAISTHVLDLGTGLPAAGQPVVMQQRYDCAWQTVSRSATDGTGRCTDLPAPDPSGDHLLRLLFARPDGMFPEIVVTFRWDPGQPHLHVPVLVSPFGYSVYRGHR